jgi:hypothetical protein
LIVRPSAVLQGSEASMPDAREAKNERRKRKIEKGELLSEIHADWF